MSNWTDETHRLAALIESNRADVTTEGLMAIATELAELRAVLGREPDERVELAPQERWTDTIITAAVNAMADKAGVAHDLLPTGYHDQVPTLLRDIRNTLGITQTELAERLGVSFTTVNRWEGANHRPQRAQLARIMALASEVLADEADVPRTLLPEEPESSGFALHRAMPENERTAYDRAAIITGHANIKLVGWYCAGGHVAPHNSPDFLVPQSLKFDDPCAHAVPVYVLVKS